MSELSAFANILNFGREAVNKEFYFTGENETPLLNWIMKRPKQLLTEQGYRIPILTQRPGGHTSFGRDNVDFNAPVAEESDSMRTYPVWYALPFKMDGSLLRALKRGDENQFLQYGNWMAQRTKAAKKRLNQHFHEDGTGALAITTTATSGTGSVTLTCQTLASAGQGAAETKGATRLEIGHRYAIINASTGAVKSIGTVTARTKTTVTINITTHTTNAASGDPIVDAGAISAFKKVPMGLRSAAAATGILQNISRSDYPDLATPRINGLDQPITPMVFASAKTLVNIAANDMNEAVNRVVVIPPGQDLALRIQQFGYRQYNGNETVKGVAGKFVDADGDSILMDADGADDRIYILDGNSYKLGEEKSFGMYNADEQEIRMLAGANSAGSDAYYGAIGWGGNLIKEGRPQCDAYIDRLGQTGVYGQISL